MLEREAGRDGLDAGEEAEVKSDDVDGFEEDRMDVMTVPRDQVMTVSGEICVCCGAWIPEGRQIGPACSAILRGEAMSMKNGVWHDVKLDPPKDGGSYLVATDRGAVAISRWYPPMVINGIETGGKFGGFHGRVTHWMPKPKPPQE